MYGIALLLHILAATIWTGGHLLLALIILPRVLKNKDLSELLRFESGYEKIGIPALLVQVATGVWLAHRMVPDMAQWLTFDSHVTRLVGTKLLLLAVTVAFAVDARLRVLPKLTHQNLTALAWHIIPVTVIAVLFVVVGVSFRTGWLY